ncbi:hypothetical protein [Roseomonas sp. CECT 9278]|uniref:hypothetical protein n=1 Tax=Roseomonas sp. CECT 9278 TaxID=2845823 RepID=UPI001E42649C|nr:hypothetical protein [Roseomonas sp. CECT 9278]
MTRQATHIPLLASHDSARKVGVHRDRLGVAPPGQARGRATPSRDAMERDGRRAPAAVPGSTARSLRRGEGAASHGDSGARGVPALSPIATRPRTMAPLHVIDVHGYLRRFGCAPQEIDRSPKDAEPACSSPATVSA